MLFTPHLRIGQGPADPSAKIIDKRNAEPASSALSPIEALREFEYLTGLTQTSIYKGDAIRLLGGAVATAASALGITHSAVCQWPDRLPCRTVDRVSPPDEYSPYWPVEFSPV